LIRFTSFPKKLEALQATRNLMRTNIRTEHNKDYYVTTDTHEQLIPYLKDARNQGNITHLQKDKIVVSRKVYGLNFSKKTTRYTTITTSWTALLQKGVSICHSNEVQWLTHMNTAVLYSF
jgi:predicted transcriptional regulator